MTRPANKYDAVVIGGGHNGLVCAAYLGRAGLRVVVVERRERLGGMAETAELMPGVRVPTLAHTVERLSPRVARELGLRGHGLRLFSPDVRVLAPQPGNEGSLVLYGDAQRTAESLSGNRLVGAGDADAWIRADREIRLLAGALYDMHGRAPVDIAAPSLGDVLDTARRALRSRGRARPYSGGLLRVMPMAVRDLVDEWFQSDALRAVVAARGLLYTAFGPRMPGTAGVLLTDAAGNDGGLAGQTVFARGGPGALTDALAAAARAAGVEFRNGVGVELVKRNEEQSTGVVLAGGEEIEATVVVSTLDPRTTLLGLLEPEVLGPRLSWRASNIRQRGVTAKVNYALSGLPAFSSSDPDSESRSLRGRILLAPSMAALERATDPAKYCAQAEEPLIEATIPTLSDATLVDPHGAQRVKHVLSAVVQAAVDESIGDAATRTIERYAPGFADLIVERQVITPADIERDWGTAGGHPMHAEVGLDQWFEWRPLHGFGRYRMPLNGFYLAGAGAHPGGGVTGMPGYLAAQAVLQDRRR